MGKNAGWRGTKAIQDRRSMKEILMHEPYKFFDTTLMEGMRYKVGAMYGGHELTEDRAKRLIEEGWAEEVAK